VMVDDFFETAFADFAFDLVAVVIVFPAGIW
jgi:hypothetical protein